MPHLPYTPSDRLGEEHLLHVVRGADPAAGAEARLTVPGGEVWEVFFVSALLATDATVANRRPSLLVQVEGQTIWQGVVGNDQPASLTWRHNWAGGLNPGGSGASAVAQGALPTPLTLGPAAVLSTLTTAIAVGDNWQPLQAYVRESPLRAFAAAIAFELAERLRAEESFERTLGERS